MGKKFFLFFMTMMTGLISLSAGETIVVMSSLGARLEVEAASFTPGDILVARLENPASLKKAVVRYARATFELGSREGGFEPLALIGLDLAIAPGSHVLEVVFVGKENQVETVKQEFSVRPREFPVKKLWVEEKYVTPPPEVQERIAWEAELLRTIYQTFTPRWLAQGPFIVPHEGRIAPNFGEKRVYNNVPRSTHSGVDISGSAGDPVRASNTGRVVLARDLYFSGKTVILDHGLGLFTYYCHFSSLNVRRGKLVQKGDIIGLVGSTGRSTGPHLHWGAKVLDSRVDPLALLNLPLKE